MKTLEGDLHQTPLTAVVRSIYLERRTGLLELETGGKQRRFYFVNGELHLPSDHPLIERWREQAPELFHSMSKEGEWPWQGRPEIRTLMHRIAELLARLQDGRFRFREDSRALGYGLVGPFPTAYLVMEASVLERNDAALLVSLGGEEARIVAPRDLGSLEDVPPLQPQDAYILSRLETPITIRELLDSLAMDRTVVLQALGRLQAVHLVSRVEDRSAPQGRAAEETLVTPEVLQRFLERIRPRVEAEPPSLDPEVHRERLARLMAGLGKMTYYDLLDIRPGVSSDEIHRAYDIMGCLVHPANAGRLGLEGKEGALEVLFERVTEAYLTLIDDERRKAYNRRMEIFTQPALLPSAERPDEERRLARQYFDQAKAFMANEEYHFAVELLRQAVVADPRAEYYAALAEAQSRNPKWRSQAMQSYQQAIRLYPTSGRLRLGFARMLEELGEVEQARGVYQEALALDSSLADAAAALKRLSQESQKKPGLLARLRNLWGGGGNP